MMSLKYSTTKEYKPVGEKLNKTVTAGHVIAFISHTNAIFFFPVF